MKNKILFDDYKTRLTYVEWVKQSFKKNDLFVTVNCPTVWNMSQFVNAKLNAIEQTIFLRRPSNLYRFVMLVTEPQRHIHLLISNVSGFKNNKYRSFSDLVYSKFRRSFVRDTDVDVQHINNNIHTIAEYVLLKQESCKIDSKSMFLPSNTVF